MPKAWLLCDRGIKCTGCNWMQDDTGQIRKGSCLQVHVDWCHVNAENLCWRLCKQLVKLWPGIAELNDFLWKTTLQSWLHQQIKLSVLHIETKNFPWSFAAWPFDVNLYEQRTKPITSAKGHGWNGHRFLCVPYRSWGFGVRGHEMSKWLNKNRSRSSKRKNSNENE